MITDHFMTKVFTMKVSQVQNYAFILEKFMKFTLYQIILLYYRQLTQRSLVGKQLYRTKGNMVM